MKIRRIISKERLEEMIKHEDCDSDYYCSLNEEVLPSEIISMARELRAWRKMDDECKIDLRGFSPETIEEFRRAKEQG